MPRGVVLAAMRVNAKAKGTAPATSTEAPGVQAKVVMGVVMNHVRVVAVDVDAATNGKRISLAGG